MFDPALIAAGAGTGFLVGLTGVGGGALMTPLLMLLFGVFPVTAVATDLWFAAITKMVAAKVHGGNGHVDWRVVGRLWLGSLPAALLVVTLVALGFSAGKVAWLGKAIGVMVMIAAIGLLFAPRLAALARARRFSNPESFKALQPVLTILAGGALGLGVALTSVGAGAIGSVMLLYLYPLRMTAHRLVATDIVHAIPLTLVAGTGYLASGFVDGAMLANLLMGSVPAALAGSVISQKIPARKLQIGLAVTLLLSGLRVFS